MTRKMYELTEKQIQKAQNAPVVEMPTDEEFKDEWKRTHRGKEKGWGMGKADFIKRQMKSDLEYVRGLWQGMVDKANGLDYHEERNENVYNLGYYRGYTNYESNCKGWDAGTRERFNNLYLS